MGHKPSSYQRLRTRTRGLVEALFVPQAGAFSRTQKFVHFCIMAWRSFTQNRCPARAAALAYGTLLALIPMLAVVLSVTSTFLKQEGEDRIDQFIGRVVATVVPEGKSKEALPFVGPPAPETAATSGTNMVRSAPEESGDTSQTVGLQHNQQVAQARREAAKRINDFIQNTRSGTLGVTGSVLLIFAAISLLTRIEDTFNDIWGVVRGRSWFMRIVLYWGVLSLVPMLVVLAWGLATGSQVQTVSNWISGLPFVGKFFVQFGFQVLPVVLLCLTFGVFYMLMPNTRVDWRAALVGGLVAGLLLHLNNSISVLYVSRVVSNSKIYGSLGLVPVFMIGIYLAWLILLFGAQMAYAFQNLGTYLESKQVENVNQRGREFVALRLMTMVGQRHLQGELPPDVPELAEELSIPSRLVQEVLQTLVGARLLVVTAGERASYVPARPMEQITCHDILQAMRAFHGQDLATRDEPSRAEVFGEFQRIQEAERQAAASVTMLALAARAQAQVQMQAPRKPDLLG